MEAERIPSNILKILRTMKKSEICEVTVKTKRFLENETVLDTSNINPEIETIILNVTSDP